MIPRLDNDGRLPPGRHPAVLPEIYDRFVVEAPFKHRRELVWAAFELWSGIVWDLFPTAPLWVDGGFVTHKSWAAPKDIDVVAIIRATEYNSKMTPSLEGQLWTFPNEDPTLRVQPMGGYVDGFASLRGRDNPLIWNDLWSSVTDADGNQVPGTIKGYLEVKKP